MSSALYDAGLGSNPGESDLFWLSFDFRILWECRMWNDQEEMKIQTSQKNWFIIWFVLTRALVTFVIDDHGYGLSS